MFWICAICYAIVALAAYVASVVARPVAIVVADSSRGVVRLRFRNLKYGRRVATHHLQHTTNRDR